MLTLTVGIFVMGVVVALLILNKTSPVVGLVIVPVIGALILGYSIDDIGGFLEEGFDTVISVAIMFLFAVLFFGIMNEVGLLDPIINGVIRLTKGNIILIAMGTVLVGAMAHLDGSGATTFLITIPAFLPIYKQMGMRPNLLVMLVASSIGIMNFTPWGGPIARSASVTGINAAELWRPLIPLQIVGLLLLLAFAGFLGWREKKRILQSETGNQEIASATEYTLTEKNNSLPQMIINWIIFIGILILMMGDFLDPSFAFIIGFAIALPINFKSMDKQSEAIKRHAPNAVKMAVIIIGAGMFLGIIEETGMLNEIATGVVHILPQVVIPSLHLIVGVFGLPLDIVTSTDAYYFALLDLVDKIVSPYDVDSSSVVYSMAIGNNFGAMISPLSPATWLGVGLAGVSIGSHLKYSFLRMWAFSIILLIAGVILQIVPLT